MLFWKETTFKEGLLVIIQQKYKLLILWNLFNISNLIIYKPPNNLYAFL